MPKNVKASRRRAVLGAGADFPIVAIGASAGGLKAFTQFLSSLPPDSGMGFVLVPHVAPQYKSHLTEILSRATRLRVTTARGGEPVLPNRVYVVPSSREMVIKGGILRLASARGKDGRGHPIDGFLRSLARDRKNRAIGIVLSGEGSDGAEGLRAIKAGGGATFAQDERTAEHPSMPRAAADAGCVDFILSPVAIARKLAHAGGGDGHAPLVMGKPGGARPARGEGWIKRILALLRTATGVDFELYKQSTLRRRILRRMALKRAGKLEKYIGELERDPVELEALYRDILIPVTSFFREPEAFRALKTKIYPMLLKHRPAQAPIRIWVPGCSTGEEAYSHAINLAEFLGSSAAGMPFQIFATDINAATIEKARFGLYPKKIKSEISPGRLRRFFVETKEGYQIIPALRERCVFARQNLVQDPPFSNLDLISCRNLLIYLGPALQEQALRVFHYALKPGGILMLGRSERVGDVSGRFVPLEVDGKVYYKRSAAGKGGMELGPSRLCLDAGALFKEKEPGARGERKPAADAGDLPGDWAGVLPARYMPNGVVVSDGLDILRFIGNTSPYLRPTPGRASLNLRRMASGELLLALRAALYMAGKSGSGIRKEAPHPADQGRRVRIEVIPILAPHPYAGHFLALFEEPAEANLRETASAENGRRAESLRVRRLQEDLAVSNEHLQSIIEEQEAINAQLKASNEDLLSSKEELQSINEEFETAKEELQSSNEELITSNEEVRQVNETLGRANSDLSNLLANIDIPIVMLGRDLRVRRFTPRAEKALRLAPADIGRSIAGLRLAIRVPKLKELLARVIKTGDVHEQEVLDAKGRWYYLWIRPYRVAKNKISGAVLTLIDIHDRKLAEKSSLRLAALVRNSNDAVIIRNLKGRILSWNQGATAMYGYAESAALGMNIRRLIPKKRRGETRALLRLLAQGKKPASLETRRCARDGRILDVWLTATALRDRRGRPVELATTERDITEIKRTEEELKFRNAILRTQQEVSIDGFLVVDDKGGILSFNNRFSQMWAIPPALLESRSDERALRFVLPKLADPEGFLARVRCLYRHKGERSRDEIAFRDGRIFERYSAPMHGPDGRYYGRAWFFRDITERKQAEKDLRSLHARVVSTRETECRRLSRELHDGVGQILSGVKFRLQSLPTEAVPLSRKARRKISEVETSLDRAIAEIRRVSQNMLPSELEDLGLQSALRNLGREFAERLGIPVSVRAAAFKRLDADLELAFFRIAQEALANVEKHARATRAALCLARRERDIELRVRDNGRGCDLGREQGRARRLGLGLGNIRERIQSVGGVMDFHSRQGKGTRLVIRAPLEPDGKGRQR